jgi:hypothetical protein
LRLVREARTKAARIFHDALRKVAADLDVEVSGCRTQRSICSLCKSVTTTLLLVQNLSRPLCLYNMFGPVSCSWCTRPSLPSLDDPIRKPVVRLARQRRSEGKGGRLLGCRPAKGSAPAGLPPGARSWRQPRRGASTRTAGTAWRPSRASPRRRFRSCRRFAAGASRRRGVGAGAPALSEGREVSTASSRARLARAVAVQPASVACPSSASSLPARAKPGRSARLVAARTRRASVGCCHQPGCPDCSIAFFAKNKGWRWCGERPFVSTALEF